MIGFIKKLLPSEGRGLLNNRNRNYVVGSQIIGAVIALISGKIIAIYIYPKDFGIYSLQWAAFTFFSTLLITPMVQFVKTTYFTILKKIGSWYYLITLSALMVLAYIGTITFFSIYYVNISLALASILFLLTLFATMNSIVNNYLNISNRLIDFSKIGIVRTLLGLVVLLIFLVFKLWIIDPILALWSVQLIMGLFGFILFAINFKTIRTYLRIDYRTFLRKYFKFAIPLMSLAIWAWINNYFDRYAIEFFLSTSDVGIYTANYAVGSKFFLVLSPVFIVLLTPKVYSITKRQDKKKSVRKYTGYYIITGIPILIIIYFFRDFIGHLLLSENYSAGFSLIFWISLAFYLFSLTQLYELIFYAEYKTRTIFYGNAGSALVNISLNIVLIPAIGIMGAAIATCIAFLTHYGIIFLNFRRL